MPPQANAKTTAPLTHGAAARGHFRRRLNAWFLEKGRDLPWRRTRDPYAILVSELMLQQTQVARVVPRYLEWLERWPTAEAPRRRLERGRDSRLAGARLQPARSEPSARGARGLGERLARGPDAAGRRGQAHGGGGGGACR